jgi:cbb3-type cytochrome oxidase subunit 1
MMDWFVKAFLKAALTWLGLGVLLGLAMALQPAWIAYRPAHAHLNVAGFVVMTIYGVAYHVIPRFTGHPLYSRRLAVWHFWLANIGLAILVLGFALTPLTGRYVTPVLGVGGVLSAAGAFAFIWNLWRTIDGPAGMRGPQAPGPRRLNVMGDG